MTHNILAGNWITAAEDLNGASLVFRRKFILEQKKVRSAMLAITALGFYEASLNGRRIGTDVLQPGFTAYQHRLQYQTYDVTELLEPENELTALVGNGWAVGRIGFNGKVKAYSDKPALIATLAVEYQDGSRVLIITDRDWEYAQSKVRFSDIYDGETYDASWQVKDWKPVLLGNYQKENLIPQEGAPIREHNVFQPILLKTPRGETVLDFGQNLTGYVRFTVKGEPGAEDAHEWLWNQKR